MKPFEIRDAAPDDIDQLIDLCRLHAEYENANYTSVGKKKKLGSLIFSDETPLFCCIAHKFGRILGYATASKEISTWDADYFLHMDCLFVLEEARGIGIGTKLIERIRSYAIDSLCTHIQWQTPAQNTSSIEFYKRKGTVQKEKIRFFLELE